MSRFGNTLDGDFAASVFGETLPQIAEWMAENLCPEDVFTDSQLEEWAEQKRVYEDQLKCVFPSGL